MNGSSVVRGHYNGPAIVTVDGTSIPVEAHLRLLTDPGGPLWDGRIWTDDLTADFTRIADGPICVLRVDDRVGGFRVDRILDHHAHITGTGLPPF